MICQYSYFLILKNKKGCEMRNSLISFEDLVQEAPVVQEAPSVDQIEDLPIEEMTQVTEDQSSLEDAVSLIEEMQDVANQQEATIEVIEGDATDINSNEEGELVSEEVVEDDNVSTSDPVVVPEFTANDVESNPELVQSVVTEREAGLEAFAQRLVNGSVKNGSTRALLLKRLGKRSVSHEAIMTSPYEAYKVSYEALTEMISKVKSETESLLNNVLGTSASITEQVQKWHVANQESNKQLISQFSNLDNFDSIDVESLPIEAVLGLYLGNDLLAGLRQTVVNIKDVIDNNNNYMSSSVLTEKLKLFFPVEGNDTAVVGLTGKLSGRLKVLVLGPNNETLSKDMRFDLGTDLGQKAKQHVAENKTASVKDLVNTFSSLNETAVVEMNNYNALLKEVTEKLGSLENKEDALMLSIYKIVAFLPSVITSYATLLTSLRKVLLNLSKEGTEVTAEEPVENNEVAEEVTE